MHRKHIHVRSRIVDIKIRNYALRRGIKRIMSLQNVIPNNFRGRGLLHLISWVLDESYKRIQEHRVYEIRNEILHERGVKPLNPEPKYILWERNKARRDVSEEKCGKR